LRRAARRRLCGRRQEPNVRSLGIEQHGALVREQYCGGGDATTPHDVRSVTKSVMSLLIGIAVSQGCLSLDSTLGATLQGEAPGQRQVRARAGLWRAVHLHRAVEGSGGGETSDWIGQGATAEQTFDGLYDVIARQILPAQ
jgi:CubicO group peptidase (beta-lactamase class C family)